MVRPRQVGPNLPSGLRRPDRSVDLRNTPVQQMGVHHLPTSGMPPPPAQGTEAFNWWRYDLLLRGRSDADLDAEIDEVEEWLADPPADEVGIGLEENAESRLERALAEKARRVAEAAGEAEEEGAEGVDEAEMRAVPSLGPQVLPQNVPVPNFQGPQAHMATGTPPGRVPGFRPGNEPQGSPQGGPGHRGRPPGGQSGPEGPRHPSNPNWYPGGTDWAEGPPGYDPAEWVTDEFGNWIDPDTGEIPPASVGSGNVPASDEGVAQLIIDTINKQRAEQGLPPLTEEEKEAIRNPPPPTSETRAVSPRSNALSNIMAMASGDPNQEILPGLTPEDEALAWIEKIRQGELDTAKDPLDRPRPKGPPVGGEPPPLPPPVSPMISQMAGPMDYPDWRGDLDDWVPPDEEWSPEGGPEDLWNPESQMDRQYMAEMAAQRGAQPEHGYFGAAGSAVSGAVDDLSSMVQGMSAGERASMIGALVAAGLLMVGSGGTLIPIGLGVGAGLGAMSSAP